ncbi:hypothetical protein KDA_20630 [Dictyobacter alpinus]|uniref:Uncharacterized protein n=1 Tax=Dictyobacter alpinus TaxID=2014873 RepID=A0A402B5H3_9CHLR|nr:hypothetical protein KDA_20630 [Dictyobacter alpinus]
MQNHPALSQGLPLKVKSATTSVKSKKPSMPGMPVASRSKSLSRMSIVKCSFEPSPHK